MVADGVFGSSARIVRRVVYRRHPAGTNPGHARGGFMGNANQSRGEQRYARRARPELVDAVESVD